MERIIGCKCSQAERAFLRVGAKFGTRKTLEVFILPSGPKLNPNVVELLELMVRSYDTVNVAIAFTIFGENGNTAQNYAKALQQAVPVARITDPSHSALIRPDIVVGEVGANGAVGHLGATSALNPKARVSSATEKLAAAWGVSEGKHVVGITLDEALKAPLALLFAADEALGDIELIAEPGARSGHAASWLLWSNRLSWRDSDGIADGYLFVSAEVAHVLATRQANLRHRMRVSAA